MKKEKKPKKKKITSIDLMRGSKYGWEAPRKNEYHLNFDSAYERKKVYRDVLQNDQKEIEKFKKKLEKFKKEHPRASNAKLTIEDKYKSKPKEKTTKKPSKTVKKKK